MESLFEKKYHELERQHFWFKGRRHFITQFLKKYPRDIKILDVGCSSGLLLQDLNQIGFSKSNLFGVDISDKAINICQKNGFKNTFVMDGQTPVLNINFDFIVASDCLEHLKDDDLALKNWYKLLKENGTALIFVPAYMFLWSDHDEVNQHYRRYTKKQLTQKLKSNGFIIKQSGFWNFFLFTPIAIIRLLLKLKPTSRVKKDNLYQLPLFNKLFINLLKLENFLLKYIALPIGVSAFCVVVKTS